MIAALLCRRFVMVQDIFYDATEAHSRRDQPFASHCMGHAKQRDTTSMVEECRIGQVGSFLEGL